MNKSNVSKFFKGVGNWTSKHSPEILTGLGIASMITTTILAVKATPKALEAIEEAKDDAGVEKLTVTDTVKVAWKPYIPAAITGVTGVACLVGASRVNYRRNTALAAAYNLSRTALAEYKEKVIETIGEKKEEAIRDKIAKDKVEQYPVNSNNVIITGKGNTLCLDAVFGQYFESDMETIRTAINDLNYQMLSSEYVSLNEFYDLLGIDRIDVGDQVGWNISKQGKVEITFSSQIAKDGRPCLVLTYNVAPERDYYKFA